MAAKRKKQARRKDEPSVPGWMWLGAGLVVGAAVAVTLWVKMPHAMDGVLPRPNPGAKPQVASASGETPEGNPPAAASAVKKHKFDFYEVLPEREVVIKDEELSERVKAEQAANLAAKQQQGLASTATSTTADGSASLPKIPSVVPVPPAIHPASPAENPVAPTIAKATPPTPPDAVSPVAPSPAAVASPPPERSGQYLLQAGAFRNNAQADDLKARIAMLGLIGHVETVQTPSGEMHRVRLGPYATASELNAAKQKLSSNGMQPVAVRVK